MGAGLGYADPDTGVWIYGEGDLVQDAQGNSSFSELLNKGTRSLSTALTVMEGFGLTNDGVLANLTAFKYDERSGLNVRSAPAAGMTDHTGLLQAAIATAKQMGVYDIVIPQLDPNDASKEWKVYDELPIHTGLQVHADHATMAFYVINKPLFYVAPFTRNYSIVVGWGRLAIPRPDYFDYAHTGEPALVDDSKPLGPWKNNTVKFIFDETKGVGAQGISAGVLTYGSFGYVKGRFSGFRYGVRFSNWTGVNKTSTSSGNREPINGVLCEGNTFDVLHDTVDFGVSGNGQKGLKLTTRGSYLASTRSQDPPHAIYLLATTSGDSPSIGGEISGAAWSSDGVAFIIKGQNGVSATTLEAYACSSVLSVTDNRGPVTIGSVIGTEMTGWIGFSQTQVELGVRGEDGNSVTARGPVVVGQIHVTAAATVPAQRMRFTTINRDWTVGPQKYRFYLEEGSVIDGVVQSAITTQTAVVVYGDRSNLGPIVIENIALVNVTPPAVPLNPAVYVEKIGTAGPQGLKYQADTADKATSRHNLSTPPVMIGVTNGLVIDDYVTDSNFAYDDSLIQRITKDAAGVALPTQFRKLIWTPNGSNTMSGPAQAFPYRRTNRIFGDASGGTQTNLTLPQNKAVFYRFYVAHEHDVDAVGVNFNAPGAAGGVLRITWYNDTGTGFPGTKLADLVALQVPTAGAGVVVSAPLVGGRMRLKRGWYWRAVALQGGIGALLRGYSAAGFDMPAISSAGFGNAIAGSVPVQSNVGGAMPDVANPDEESTSAGVIRMGISVPNG